MKLRIIGMGQPAAGDDGVGLAVVEYLRRRGAPRGVELLRAASPDALMPLLEVRCPVVLVDAVLAVPPGEVLELDCEALERQPKTVSSHGLGVAQAVALARLLAPQAVSPSIRIVAISIARPGHLRQGLSPEVTLAVPRAAACVLQRLDSSLSQERSHA